MAWVHNIDPFAIQLTEHFGLRWYGLAYLSGFFMGYWSIVLLSRRGGTQFKESEIMDFVTLTAIGVLGGGRLGYALFYAPDLFTSFDGHFPYWGLLKVNEGGMASHGGIIGVMLVCMYYARKHKMSIRHVIDLTVFGGSFGFMWGRLANFINGELYGREASAGLAWAVKFPQEMSLWPSDAVGKLSGLSPAVEALGQITTRTGEILAVNPSIWQGWVNSLTFDAGAKSHIYATIDALILATQSGNTKVIELLSPVLTARHPSQLYQLVLEGLLVFVILLWVWRKPQKPGVVGGWFGVLYCVARIIGEQFRLPDAHIGYQFLGLTRGQWISFGFLAFSVGYLVTAYKSKAAEIGGWMIFPAAKK